ncbi:MAG: protein kinase [Bryobacteraceae bacterium]
MPSASRISSDRWRQIEDVFDAASQCEPASRAAFLEQACGTDAELRREVESLLANLDDGDPILESVQNAAEAYVQEQSAYEEITEPLSEGLCLDHYRIIEMLGRGGMGEVYLAEDTRLKRKVALKMLPSHLTRNLPALARLEQEARIVSGLNHANLLTVFEFCNVEGRHFLVTEFIEGETVRQMLSRGPVGQDKAVDIATQAAAALSAAHASGVIHRDIKPENIIVRTDGCVKVLDFGIAKLAEGPLRSADKKTPTTNASTAAGAILGTPRYMSPEQARGLKVDERTDFFSLGAVLYEMLTGKAPFSGDTHSDLIADILRGEPAPITQYAPKVARSLQAIVARALAKERTQRYQSAESLLMDLRQFRREAEYRSLPRVRFLWIAISLLLSVLAVTGFFIAREIMRRAPRPAPRSLAILPFRNLKPDASTDFLGLSLADEVIAKLGYVKALTVRPSSAINRYRDGSADLRKTAEELKADMLVTGTYLKDGDDLRITARLIGFNPDAVLWQDTLNVKYEKLLTVQDRVAKMIIQGLALRLEPDEQVRLKPDAPMDSLAYEYYLRGVDLYSTSDFSAAIAMLEKSVAIDANYAPTWAYLGRAYTTNASLQFGGREHYRRAEAAYDKAIALNPRFPEPRIYMANLLTDTGRVEEAVPLLRVALQSSPNNAEAHWELGYAYRYGGMLKESAAECELARRLDPEVKINSSALNTYLYLFEYDKFLKSLPVNDSPLMVFYHGFGSYYKNDYPEAATDFDRAYELDPELLPAQIGKALSDGLDHRESQGLARLHQTEVRMDMRGVSDPEAMYKLAQAYALLGDRDSALRMLRRSTVGGFFCYSYIAHDPLLSGLHRSPEFSRLLEQARQRAEQFAERFSR